MRKTPRCVLTIAGTDPSGGAGIQADIKAISATGGYAASVITALVAQNTQGVKSIQDVPPDFITQQLEVVFEDLDICAVKIGMLHNTAVITVVAAALKKYQPKIVVLDPVMVAKNGCALLDLTTIEYLKETLFPRVTLITPNLFEAEKLIGHEIKDFSAMEETAKYLGRQYHMDVLVKGGHLATPQSSDVLYLHRSGECQWFQANRIKSKNTHGTGCTLSSAIASFLAQDYALPHAMQAAKNYLTDAIIAGSTQQIGKGRGPVDHFYFLRE